MCLFLEVNQLSQNVPAILFPSPPLPPNCSRVTLWGVCGGGCRARSISASWCCSMGMALHSYLLKTRSASWITYLGKKILEIKIYEKIIEQKAGENISNNN